MYIFITFLDLYTGYNREFVLLIVPIWRQAVHELCPEDSFFAAVWCHMSTNVLTFWLKRFRDLSTNFTCVLPWESRQCGTTLLSCVVDIIRNLSGLASW